MIRRDDPHAVRERTHRATTFLPDCSPHREECRRCGDPWPCKRAGKADEPVRYRWAILAGGALGLIAAGCVLAVMWL